MVSAIFRFPTIGPKNHLFLDGTILLGYVLLFSSAFWLKEKRYQLFLAFPYVYLLLLALGQSGSGAFTFFGWYLYPLFPFLIILVAKIFYDFWRKSEIFPAVLVSLIVGSSTIRFLFLFADRKFHYLWQYSLTILILVILILPLIKVKTAKAVMLSLFVLFLVVNILIIFNLDSIYQLIAINDQSLKGF